MEIKVNYFMFKTWLAVVWFFLIGRYRYLQKVLTL